MSKPKNQMRFLNVNRYILKKQSLISEYTKDLEEQMHNILKNKISGLSFSPYLEDQDPNDKIIISEKQIAKRLEIIRPYTNWIRTFSTTHGNEEVPRIAHEKGLKTMVGAWIGTDLEHNETELANLIAIAKAGHVDMAAIGNEVLLREDLEVEQLLEYIHRFKEAVPNVPVGYVDAYYMYFNFLEIVDACDIIFANCYPIWEYCALEISVEYMKKMYELAKEYAKGKQVVISETGWPSKGEQYGGAIPSYENAMRYFISTFEWTQKENILLFYFSSFDEVWKMNPEGEYGGYWGLFDKDGKYKFISKLLKKEIIT